jgi:hypothetical protein
MLRTKVHYIFAIFLLTIFSIGTFHDVCAQNEWKAPATETALSPTESVTASPTSGTETADCHCLCHFSFQAVNIIRLEGDEPHHPLAATIKETVKEAPMTGVFRPPISLLS